jgi:hypothetical protein
MATNSLSLLSQELYWQCIVISGAFQAGIHLGIEKLLLFVFFLQFVCSVRSACDERGHLNSFGFITFQKCRVGSSMEN